MNKEDYVSLEVAKLLKEKGFNDVCDRCYYIEDDEIAPLFYGTYQNEGELYVSGHLAAPTLYESAKWLRKERGIFIDIGVHYNQKCEIVEYEYRIATYFDFLEKHFKWRKSKEYYEKYEQCLNNAILEALKLI